MSDEHTLTSVGGYQPVGDPLPVNPPQGKKMPAEVISVAELQERAAGTPIEIPDWLPHKTIWVRVRPIDMTPHMLKLNALPNTLKAAATEVFHGEASDSKTAAQKALEETGKDNIELMLPILDGIAADVLVQPSYTEIQALLPLTLNQKMALFKFAMGGLDSLESFRSGLG